MNLAGFILLVITAVCMAGANILIKTSIMAAGGFDPSVPALLRLCREPAFIAGLGLSAPAALMWFKIVATQKLSTCYPLFVSFTYCLVTLGAFYYLHEKISVQKMAGLVTIIAGITAVARG